MDLLFCSSQGIRIPSMRSLGLCVFQTLHLILKPNLLDQAFGSGTVQNEWKAEGARWNDSPLPLTHTRGLQTSCPLFWGIGTCCGILHTRDLCLPPTRESSASDELDKQDLILNADT